MIQAHSRHTDPGVSAELGVGIDLDGFRVEATLRSMQVGWMVTPMLMVWTMTMRRAETRKQSAFLTGYWDVMRNKTWTPYLGAGFGYSNLDVRDFSDGGALIQVSAALGLSVQSWGRSRSFQSVHAFC